MPKTDSNLSTPYWTYWTSAKLLLIVARGVIKSTIVVVQWPSLLSPSCSDYLSSILRHFRVSSVELTFWYIKPYNLAEVLKNRSPWRNRLARLTVNQEVGSSSLPGDEFSFFFFTSYRTKPRFLALLTSILDSTPTMAFLFFLYTKWLIPFTWKIKYPYHPSNLGCKTRLVNRCALSWSKANFLPDSEILSSYS